MQRFFRNPFPKRQQSRRTVTRSRRPLGLEVLEDRGLLAPLSFVVRPLPVAVNTVLNPLDGVRVQSPDRYYRSYLGRDADPAGAQAWLSLLQSGQWSPAQAFLASDEFFSRAGQAF
jgi:hypothetical protein